MRVFAKNPVLAKSKFWYHMKRQHKVRKVQGEIVSVQEIYEKHAGVVKNYGIVLRYLSRTETINMYKEFRDTTLAGAVSQMCKFSLDEMQLLSSGHRKCLIFSLFLEIAF